MKGTANYSLCYQGGDLKIIGYTDADWAGDLDGRKSTSGYTFLLNGGAISWASKKQTCITLSTMEAKFVTSASAVQEAVWLRRFLQHFGIVTNAQEMVTIYCDNQASIAYTKDPKYHGKTKHIDIKYNYVKEIVSRGEVVLQYLNTHQMLADPLTKPIGQDVFKSHVKTMGLRCL